MHAAGKLKDPEPKVFPESAYGDLLISHFATSSLHFSICHFLPFQRSLMVEVITSV